MSELENGPRKPKKTSSTSKPTQGWFGVANPAQTSQPSNANSTYIAGKSTPDLAPNINYMGGTKSIGDG